MRLGAKDWGYGLGAVRAMTITPDGCATALTWKTGGLSVWSTFGALLMCTLAWDYGLIENTVNIISMVSHLQIIVTKKTLVKYLIISVGLVNGRLSTLYGSVAR